MTLPVELLTAICEFASELPSSVLTRVTDAMRLAEDESEHEVVLRTVLPLLHADNRGHFHDLMTAWARMAPQLSGAEVAAAIDGAAYQERLLRAKSSIELVWTGPTSPSSGLRSTEQVLLEMIRQARQSIYLVTFAAYKVPGLVRALQDAVARGVRVAFFLEDKEESAGKVDSSPIDAFDAIGNKVIEVYLWPLEMRPRNERGQFGSLHAKCVITDREHLFVSSANLTEFALNLNMELGVLVTGGNAPAQAADSLDALVWHGVLRAFC